VAINNQKIKKSCAQKIEDELKENWSKVEVEGALHQNMYAIERKLNMCFNSLSWF